MNDRGYSSIPAVALAGFLGLLPVGILLGALYGAGVIPALAVSAVVLGALAVFVPWAVLKLDPRRISELGSESGETPTPEESAPPRRGV
jgi:hypothetical protein